MFYSVTKGENKGVLKRRLVELQISICLKLVFWTELNSIECIKQNEKSHIMVQLYNPECLEGIRYTLLVRELNGKFFLATAVIYTCRESNSTDKSNFIDNNTQHFSLHKI